MTDPNDDDFDYDREREEAFADANAWGDSFDYDNWEPPSTLMDD
jgi:hypothetical protein